MTQENQKPYVIVLGNEKGGTGKSTTAMHIMTALLKLGYSVGSIDVDARQGTLTRYVENRRHYIKKHGIDLKLPEHYAVLRSSLKDLEAAMTEEQEHFNAAFQKLQTHPFIIIDTAGSDTYLSRYAHSFADTLVTPLNDSFVDLDVLTHLEPESLQIASPSIYAEWVWEQKKQKALRDRGTIDWIVLRNRLTTIHSKNKEKMENVLSTLSKRLAFRLLPGFSERVIFRELFTSGLTLLDLHETGENLTLSHIAAKQELRNLMESFKLPGLQEKVASNF
jgi:chromosome partitioning protein